MTAAARASRLACSTCLLAGLVLLSAGEVNAVNRHPAIYLVFEARADGFRLIHRRDVELSAPVVSLSEAELRKAERDAEPRGRGVGVRLRDGRGHEVFRQHLELPEWIRGEFRGRPEGSAWQIESYAVPDPSPAFAVRVPAGRGRDLRLQGRNRAAALDLAAPGPLEAIATGVAVTATAPSGSPANRLHLLLIGDGYTAAQQALFEANADTVEAALLGVTPYADYRNYVNVHRLFVPSQQSGADHPPYAASCSPDDARCCADLTASGDPLAGRFVRTAFDA